MRAAFFKGDEKIVLQEVPVPDRKSGQALIKVKACGVCGSEKKMWRQGKEVIPGHEAAGEVQEVDEDSAFAPGDRVALYLPHFCGTCYYCQQGKTNLCRNIEDMIGHNIDGGYAEYVVVEESTLIDLEGLSYEEGVLLLDTIGTTGHGLRMGRAAQENLALVVGCGPIGLGAAAVLKCMGLKKIYATDIIPERLDYAEKLGAVPLDVRNNELAGTVENEHPEGFPLIINCVGSPQTIKENLKYVTGGGKIVYIGEYWQEWTIKPRSDFMLKDWSFIRSWYFPLTEVEANRSMLQNHPEISEKIISHTFSLSEIDRAFDLFFQGQTAKAVIKF